MRTWLPALVLATSIAAPAHADDSDGGHGLYLGTGNHVKIGTGFGILVGGGATDGFSIAPTIEGRIKLGEKFGLQLVLPFTFTSVSIDSPFLQLDDSSFTIGNPSVAFEVVLDDSGFGATIVRGGVAAPVAQIDTVAEGMGYGIAVGSHGGFNLWRYAPEALSFFGEIVGTVASDGLFMEFGGGLGVLIPTSDGGGDAQVVLQGSAKIGLGDTVIPFAGLGLFLNVSNLGEENADAAQLGLQLGVIAKLGKARLDAALQLNLDDPYGFSLDEGILGLNAAVTIPF